MYRWCKATERDAVTEALVRLREEAIHVTDYHGKSLLDLCEMMTNSTQIKCMFNLKI